MQHSTLCLPDLPSEPNPDQAVLVVSCWRSSALAHATGRIRAAQGLLLEPPSAGHPGTVSSGQRPICCSSTLTSTEKSGAMVKGDKGTLCPPLPPKQSEVSSLAQHWNHPTSRGCSAGRVLSPHQWPPALAEVVALTMEGWSSTAMGPSSHGSALGSALGSMRSHVQLQRLQAQQPSPAASFSNQR